MTTLITAAKATKVDADSLNPITDVLRDKLNSHAVFNTRFPDTLLFLVFRGVQVFRCSRIPWFLALDY